MAQLVVRNIDDGALEEMRAIAKRNARSLEAEVRLMIEEAARRERNRADFWRSADEIRESLRGTPQTDSAMLRKIGRRGEEDL